MRLLLAPALASLVLGLSACTTGYVRFDCPPGNPWPLSGWNCMGGYSEIEIAPNTYTVRFEGKGISNANAEDFTLLRAAELTLSKDRRYFLVLGASDDSTTRTTTTPSTYSPGQTICDKDGNCTTTMGSWSGGGSSSTLIPAYAITIRILDDPKEAAHVSFDAATIQRSIRTKYQLWESRVAAGH